LSSFTKRIAHPDTGAQERVLAKQHGKWLLERYYAAPDGSYDTFTLFGQKDWSVVLALTARRNFVLTVYQFKHGCDKHILELPAGTAKFDAESAEAVMQRELLEETGYRAGTMTGFQPFWIASQGSPTRFKPFLALDCEYVQKPTSTKAETIHCEQIGLELWIRMIWGANYGVMNYAGDVDPRPTPAYDIIEEPSAVVATMMALPELLRRGLLTGEFLASIRAETDQRK